VKVGTIFPAVLSYFLFSSGASTQFWVMALMYGVTQSHSLDTQNTHTHHIHMHAHTQPTYTRTCALCRIPVDEWSAHHRDLYVTTHNTHRDKHPFPRWDWSTQSQQTRGHKTHILDSAATTYTQFTYLNRRQWRNIVNWIFFPNESHLWTGKL
jgi:hypothetical protein